MSRPSYVIGTAWWCDEGAAERHRVGDDVIRSRDFHRLWYRSVDTFTDPRRILIVDSASPVRPEVNRSDDRIQWLRLDRNPGHPTNHEDRYCGWTVSVLLGLRYALHCGVDCFVYVEQDALLYGKGIVETCMAAMRRPWMFGSGDGTTHPLQQSFFLVRRDGMERLARRVEAIAAPDRVVSPEKKFCIACSPVLRRLPLWLFAEHRHWQDRTWLDRRQVAVHRWLLRRFARFDVIPFGYGGYKDRAAVNFSDPMFYFQHGSRAEIAQYIARFEREFGPAGVAF